MFLFGKHGGRRGTVRLCISDGMWVHYSIKRSFKAGLKVDAFPADEVKMGLSLYRDGGPKKRKLVGEIPQI